MNFLALSNRGIIQPFICVFATSLHPPPTLGRLSRQSVPGLWLFECRTCRGFVSKWGTQFRRADMLLCLKKNRGEVLFFFSPLSVLRDDYQPVDHCVFVELKDLQLKKLTPGAIASVARTLACKAPAVIVSMHGGGIELQHTPAA